MTSMGLALFIYLFLKDTVLDFFGDRISWALGNVFRSLRDLALACGSNPISSTASYWPPDYAFSSASQAY